MAHHGALRLSYANSRVMRIHLLLPMAIFHGLTTVGVTILDLPAPRVAAVGYS
jgi:hypothetical protein